MTPVVSIHASTCCTHVGALCKICCCPGHATPNCRRLAACSIAAGHDIYNTDTEVYDVAACDADPGVPRNVSAECKAFFQAEFCFYECDVNLSKYRCATARLSATCC